MPRYTQWELLEHRQIAVASPLDAVGGSPGTPCHRTHFGHTQSARRSSAFPLRSEWAPWYAVGSQQQRSNSAVRSPRAPRGRRVHAAGTHVITTRTEVAFLHGDLTEAIETSLRLYRVLTACLWRLHCACTEYHLFHCALTETTQSCHGNIALPWRSHGAPRRL